MKNTLLVFGAGLVLGAAAMAWRGEVQRQQQGEFNRTFAVQPGKYEAEALRIQRQAECERRAALEQADYDEWLKSMTNRYER